MDLKKYDLIYFNMETRTIIIIGIIVTVLLGGTYFAWSYFFKKPQNLPLLSDDSEDKLIEDMSNPIHFEDITSHAYFDIDIGDEHAGRIIMQLFDEEVPKTCKNFRYLCSQNKLKEDKPTYQNTSFHRVIKDFMIQGGDITNGDGTGGYSIYGEKFEDENFNLMHNQPGLLSMANSGPNTNNSQFFITLNETPWLDNLHVVFGIVISGFDIVKKIESIETGENDKPLQTVTITKSGLIHPEKN